MSEYKIYPKQFRNKKIPVEKNRCFFIMPFSDKFDIVYGEIKAALTKEGYICVRVDEVPGSIPIITQILTEILKSQFVIADLSTGNPNVFYELGIAHTFKDAENIFLLKEQTSIVPFDITHLKYIEYSIDNLRLLTAKLKVALLKNTYLSSFYETLNTHDIIKYVHENHDEFIDILKNMLGSELQTVTEILEDSCELPEENIKKTVENIQTKLKQVINTYSSSIIKGIMFFNEELLLACDKYNFVKDILYSFLSDYFTGTHLGNEDIISYQTCMVVKFASKNKQLNITMPWIISYFKRSKFATIDLNRYNLESFLLTTDSLEINNHICNAVLDIDAHVREHFADLIGEKKLSDGYKVLCQQLICEKNYYSASSIIEALGKLRKKEGIQYIKIWINENEEEIIKTKNFFVFKHARIAIAQLDSDYLDIFDKKYHLYLTDYFL